MISAHLPSEHDQRGQMDSARYALASLLEESKYFLVPRVLEAWRHGVPQLRRRLFILGVRDDVPLRRPPFPEGSDNGTFAARDLIRAAEAGEPVCPPGLSVEEAIGDLPSIPAGGGEEVSMYRAPAASAYQRMRRARARLLLNHRARDHSPVMMAKMSLIDEGGRNQELPDEQRLRGADREYFSQAYARLHRHGISQTITTYFHNPGSGRFTHYRDLRSITVREAARFQSFDDDFMFVGHAESQMRQVGNAVPVLLAERLAHKCAEILRDAGADAPAHANVA